MCSRDHVSSNTHGQTDDGRYPAGVEIQQDRLLMQYDTLIIGEP